jgi:YfiH family protein
MISHAYNHMFTVDSFTKSGIKSIQSTRLGGVSEEPYASMNLGINTEDKHVAENLKLIAYKGKLPHSPVFLSQVHGNHVVEYIQAPQKHGEHDADACFTRKENVVCAVLTADCLPVLLSSKTEKLVAAIHCGWKGLHKNIIAETIKKMKVDSKDLEAWMGPCISYKAYQVGEDFRDNFVKVNKEYAHAFYQDKKKKWHADLKKIAQMQLQDLGVESLSQSPFCTFENNSLFYSYRKNNITGRMASMIWIEP